MKFDANIHGYPQLLKSIMGTVEFTFTKPRNKLFVLNYHGTPKKFISDFEEQLDLIAKYFEFISPNDFFDILNDKKKKKGNQILLTFDDGLKNNLFAMEVLNKRNISCMLFIVPAFVDSNNPKDFYLKNIRPQINPLIDSEPEDFTPLSWDDLREISKKHSIGSHTLTHTMNASSNDVTYLIRELEGSKLQLEKQLNVSVNSFCSINNSLLNLNATSKHLIPEYYDYHFTTIAGCNNKNKTPYFIKRINVECFWLPGAVKFSLGNLNIARQMSKVEEYAKM